MTVELQAAVAAIWDACPVLIYKLVKEWDLDIWLCARHLAAHLQAERKTERWSVRARRLPPPDDLSNDGVSCVAFPVRTALACSDCHLEAVAAAAAIGWPTALGLKPRAPVRCETCDDNGNVWVSVDGKLAQAEALSKLVPCPACTR